MTANASAGGDGDEAATLLASLRNLLAAGQVELSVEPRRLNHIDSPVAVEADGNIWVYGFVVLSALVWWRWGTAPGVTVLGAGILVYFTVGRAYIHRRIERRVRQDALNDLAKWRKLWRFPGLTLRALRRPDLGPCASPDGNWMAFARSLGPAGDPAKSD